MVTCGGDRKHHNFWLYSNQIIYCEMPRYKLELLFYVELNSMSCNSRVEEIWRDHLVNSHSFHIDELLTVPGQKNIYSIIPSQTSRKSALKNFSLNWRQVPLSPLGENKKCSMFLRWKERFWENDGADHSIVLGFSWIPQTPRLPIRENLWNIALWDTF